MTTWGRRKRPPGLLDGPNMILGHYGLARDCVWSSGAARATPGGCRRRLLDLKARRREVERSGEDHPGSRSGVENFRKIVKMTDFQSALFGTEIGLDRLWMCISHCAASFAMGVI